MPEFKASLGGAWNDVAKDAYPNIGYVFVELPTGERMQLFYNNETRLFVADILNAQETGGIEFVRQTVPNT